MLPSRGVPKDFDVFRGRGSGRIGSPSWESPPPQPTPTLMAFFGAVAPLLLVDGPTVTVAVLFESMEEDGRVRSVMRRKLGRRMHVESVDRRHGLEA